MTLYVVGSANMDLVVRAPRLPGPGQTVLGTDLLRTPGGKGANQAVAAARLGADVCFVGAVGSDPFGTELVDALRADGIDLSKVVTIADRASGTALIVVDEQGENQIAVAPGANAALSTAHVSAALRDLRAADVVLLQFEIPLATVHHACRLASERGARVILNAAPATQIENELLALIDVLIVNAGEAAILSQQSDVERAAATLSQRGPPVVIVTRGADGLLLTEGSATTHVPAQRVDVVDTTAAGDAFCGAFAAALAEGQTPHTAAIFASVAAALATTRLGAQASLPTRKEVAAFQRTEART